MSPRPGTARLGGSAASETSARFDVRGRRIESTAPRSPNERYTTRYEYDPAGNTTAVVRPGERLADGTITERVTAYRFDANNRVVETVVGADSHAAASAGPATGERNVRTRVDDDPDGNIVARYSPRAFAAYPAVDDRFVVRTEYDRDGRPVRQLLPRYDTADPALVAPGNDGEAGKGQDDQCATNVAGYEPPATARRCGCRRRGPTTSGS